MIKEFNSNPYLLSRHYILSSIFFIAVAIICLILDLHDFSPSVWIWILSLAPLIISSFIGVLISNVALIALYLVTFNISFDLEMGLMILLGIYVGMVNVPLIHNCAHDLFKPKWLNRVIGELLSIHLMSSYPGFSFLHLRHHQFADQEGKDPHPNKDYTFWQYLNSLKKNLNIAYKRNYFARWSENEDAMRQWQIFTMLVPVGRVLRSLMILFFLGPKIFVFFYVPSFIANQITYAHINYYTHQKQNDGSIKIINMNHNLVYKILNTILFGIYFHKDHHERPSKFNPALGKIW